MADATSFSVSTSLQEIEDRLQEPEPLCLVAVGVGPASYPEFEAWSVGEVVDEVGHRLRSTLRPYDEVRQLSGGWFAVILQTLAEAGDLEDRVRRLFGLVAAPYQVDGAEAIPRVLMGAAVRQPGERVTDLLARVEQAVDQAGSDHGSGPIVH